MTPEQARAVLVAALRSGDYDQATGALRKDDCYCCLGVACDLYQKHEGGRWDANGFLAGAGWSSAVLPKDVKKWLGFVTNAGLLNDPNESLAGCNDGGETFDEIADRIENDEVRLC